MAQETFAFFYEVQGMAPGATHGPAQSISTTLVELASDTGGIDGSTSPGDEIDWSSSGFTGPFTYIALTQNNEPIVEDFDSGVRFVLSNDGTRESDPVTPNSAPYTYCFAAGTQIATPSGTQPVENLSIGDAVLTADGKTVAVKWLGRQTLRKFLNGTRIQPVRIQAGALGAGLPHRDLTVTGEHGLVFEGLVINAAALVNGTTINWVPLAELDDSVTYYHVETENHDVILAEGAAAETFIDYLDRCGFDNYQEYLDLYGAERVIHEMPLPRISAGRLVPGAIKALLGSQAPARPNSLAG